VPERFCIHRKNLRQSGSFSSNCTSARRENQSGLLPVFHKEIIFPARREDLPERVPGFAGKKGYLPFPLPQKIDEVFCDHRPGL
jgi:hypothetical protein